MLSLRGQPPGHSPILRTLRLVEQRPYETAKKRDCLHPIPFNHTNILPNAVRVVENQQHCEHIVQQRGFHDWDRRIPYSHQPLEGDTPKACEPVWGHLLSKIANRLVLQVSVDKRGQGGKTLDGVLEDLDRTSGGMGHDTFQEFQIRKKVGTRVTEYAVRDGGKRLAVL